MSTTSRRASGRRTSGWAVAVVTLALVFTLVPLAYLAVISFMRQDEVTAGGLLPSGLDWRNWANALSSQVPHGVLNTLIASTAGALLSLAIAVPASWAFVRSSTGGRLLQGGILSPWLLPPVVAVLPIFTLLRILHLNNNLVGLTLVYGFVNAPVAIWLLEGFARRIPVALDEAAQLDGAGPWRIFARIALPLLAPGVVSVGVIVGILDSQEFLLATFFTQDASSQTAPVAIANLLGDRIQDFGKIAAAAIATIAPVYLIATLLQRRLVSGLTSGAIR